MKRIIFATMMLVTSILIADTYIVSQAGFGDFLTIEEGVDYLMDNEIDGKLIVLPGVYDEYVYWNTDISHITISGVDQETCIVEGWFQVGGMSNNENDLIENLTFRNTGVAIMNYYSGLNTIKNNKFENCTDLIVISYSSIELINNTFINNNCEYCFYSMFSAGDLIEYNVFENNTTTYSLIKIEAMNHTYIKNNTFLDNTLIYEGTNHPKGSILEMRKISNQISSGLISGNVFQNNIDESYLSNSILSIDNEDSWATFCIIDNSFIGNSAIAMISDNSNQLSGHIENTIFESNTIGGSYVIYTENLYCDYSLFFDNMTINYTLASNGNCAFGSNIFSEVDPLLDENNQPLWNSTTKSPCIDSGSGTDPDGTPADIGAVCAITHKYDIIELPSPEEDDGWKWLSFPALDTVLDEADIAENILADILDPTILDFVLAQDYEIWYDFELEEWQNDWRQFLRTEGFKFHMNDDFTLEVPGFKEPDNTAIFLTGNDEENWIGYWLEETQEVSDAFSDYWDEANIHYIQHQYWAATYWGGQWWYRVQSGHEPTLSYGDMVIVKCEEDVQSFRWDNSTPEDERTVYSETEYFTFEEQADYTPIYIELDKNNMPQEIGAFVNGECIGATVVEDTLTQINAYTTSAPPGNIELELYYGGRNENLHISSYNCVSYSYPNIVMKQLSTKKSDDAWFIDLREDSSIVSAPEKVTLSNYPNPFNPATTISYSLPQEGKVSLKIYNVKGQLVKKLIEGSQPEGYYEVVWNGKDNAGRSVASGIYYYRITACGKTINKKMLLLK